MEANFQKVLPEDFDVQTLYKAAQEGKLYINTYMSPDQLKEDIIAYVTKLKDFVGPKFKDRFLELWREILSSPKFVIEDFLFKKGKNKGRMNKRMIVAVVRYLNEYCHIFQASSSLSLVKVLEGTQRKMSIYTSSSNNESYSLSYDQMTAINHIVKFSLNE